MKKVSVADPPLITDEMLKKAVKSMPENAKLFSLSKGKSDEALFKQILKKAIRKEKTTNSPRKRLTRRRRRR